MKKIKHNLTRTVLVSMLLLLCGSLLVWKDARAVPAPLFAADFPIQVAGEVHNEAGELLLGVSVRVKGRSKGTITNISGYFEVKADTAAVLVFSYVGYVTREIPVNALVDPTDVTIVLQSVNKGLSEVVVVGYGEKKRKDLTSAVSTLDMEKVAPIPVQSINDAVAGRIPGLFVTTGDGEPGTKSQLSIRGGDPPLFIIDGVIRSQADFENINPNDIKSYSVLKDAAATSVYGAQGGNGVILVTTKSGKAGEVRVNYSFNEIWSAPTFWMPKMSTYEHFVILNKVYAAEHKPPLVNENRMKYYRDDLKVKMEDLVIKNFAPEQRHDLSVTSGNKLLTYFGSLSYYDQGTILKTNKSYNRRLTYRMNTSSNFEKVGLKVLTGLDGYMEDFSTPRSTSTANSATLFSHIFYRNQDHAVYNAFGLPTRYAGPVLELDPRSGYWKRKRRSINTRLNITWDTPVKGLDLAAKVNYGIWDENAKSWNRLAPYYADSSREPINAKKPSLIQQTQTSRSLTMQGYINYSHRFGDHSLKLSGIYEQWRYKGSLLYARRNQFDILIDQFFAGPTLNQVTKGGESEAARAGYIGRLSYSYKSKYGLDVTMRYDGNDIFPPGHRWGLFYALSGRWIVTEEKFMESLKDNDVLDYLKVRGSYGVTGRTNGIRRFQYVPGYTIEGNAYVVDGVPSMGISEGGVPSFDFSWYSIESRNLGLKFGTLDDRLTGTVDYFYMRTSGYVEPDIRYGAVLGQPLPYVNSDAARRREGFEFNVTWKDQSDKFNYALGFNFSRYNKLWEKYPGEDETAQKNPYSRRSNTDDTYLMFGQHTDGFYQHNADLMEGPHRVASVGTAAGDIRFIDTNGDGKIDPSDMRKIGANSFPHVNFGLTMDFGYKGIYLSGVIMGSGMRDRYFEAVGTTVTYQYQKDYWRPDHPNAEFPRILSNANENGGNNFVDNDFWILTSGYVRLKYLQIGYDLKYRLLKNSPFKTFKVFVSGTNLLTHSKGLDYSVDPEGNASNKGYPIQRTFALGVNLGF